MSKTIPNPLINSMIAQNKGELCRYGIKYLTCKARYSVICIGRFIPTQPRIHLIIPVQKIYKTGLAENDCSNVKNHSSVHTSSHNVRGQISSHFSCDFGQRDIYVYITLDGYSTGGSQTFDLPFNRQNNWLDFQFFCSSEVRWLSHHHLNKGYVHGKSMIWWKENIHK